MKNINKRNRSSSWRARGGMTLLSTTKIIEKTESLGARNYHPLHILIPEAKGAWVKDPEGNKYLDMLSAYSAVNQGHCHPKIINT